MIRRKWSKEEVINDIKKFGNVENIPSASKAETQCRNLLWAATKYHGGWRQAVEAAGYDYSQVRKIDPSIYTSKKMVAAAIVELSTKGEALNSWHVQRTRTSLYRTAVRFFGNWDTALEAAGISIETVRKREKFRKWSKKDIITAIQLRRLSGQSLAGCNTIKEDWGLYAAGKRYFGNWTNALEAAGYNIREENPKVIWTKRAVMQVIKIRALLGLPLNVADLRIADLGGLVGAGRRYFSTWGGALLASSVDPRSVRKNRWNYWSSERVLTEIRVRLERGQSLAHNLVHSEQGDLFSAALKHYGSWAEAVFAVGENYRKHLGHFSHKAWLRSLSQDELDHLRISAVHFATKRSTSCITKKP